MPRTVQEILDHAEELARRFEDYQPDPSNRRDPAALAAVRDAVVARSEAEQTLVVVVRAAHDKGHSWQSIGRAGTGWSARILLRRVPRSPRSAEQAEFWNRTRTACSDIPVG